MGFGLLELLLVLPAALLALAVPVALMVGLVLIYKKVARIEQMLIEERTEKG